MEGDRVRHVQGRNCCISIHSLRMEGDFPALRQSILFRRFQSTPSAWRETTLWLRLVRKNSISIHSLRMEGDQQHSCCRRRYPDISIHSLRMEGDIFAQVKSVVSDISIHSLRMEGDSIRFSAFVYQLYFNPLPPHGGRQSVPFPGVRECGISIHSLRMEGDRSECRGEHQNDAFQSTPSAWRETSHGVPGIIVRHYFNPLPPHGGRPDVFIPCHDRNFISIHSLRMEGDFVSCRVYQVGIIFQSTPSAWRETCVLVVIYKLMLYFNPLPPHGGRRF